MNKLGTKSVMSRIFTRVINASCHNRTTLKCQWLNTAKVFILNHYKFNTNCRRSGIEGVVPYSHSGTRAGKFIITLWISETWGWVVTMVMGRTGGESRSSPSIVRVTFSHGQWDKTWHMFPHLGILLISPWCLSLCSQSGSLRSAVGADLREQHSANDN